MSDMKQQLIYLTWFVLGLIAFCFIVFTGVQCQMERDQLNKEIKIEYLNKTGLAPEILEGIGALPRNPIR